MSAPHRGTKYSIYPSPRQRKVLDVLIQLFGMEMEHTPATLHAIAREMGWHERTAVRDCLFALRAKHYLQSIGGSITRPDQWRVVDPKDRADAHITNRIEISASGAWKYVRKPRKFARVG